jgi:hypothetical protein
MKHLDAIIIGTGQGRPVLAAMITPSKVSTMSPIPIKRHEAGFRCFPQSLWVDGSGLYFPHPSAILGIVHLDG